MQTKTQQQAKPTGQQTHSEKLDDINRQNMPLALPQHPKHRAVIQMPRSKTSGRQSHGHCAEQCGQECYQMQKLFGTVQGLAHFGPPSLQGFQPQAPYIGLFYIAISPSHKVADLAGFTHHRKSPVESAGRLHQLGSG